MEIYRFVELTVYSVLRFLPFLLLMFYTFYDRCRFPKCVTVIGIAAMTVLRCLCGYAPYFEPAVLERPNPGILVIVALSLIFVKEHFGKTLFTMLMLVNISGFTVVASKYFEGLFFRDNALQLHRWSNSLMLLAVEAIVLIPLFFYIKREYLKALRQSMPQSIWSALWIIPFTLYAVWYRNSYMAEENHEALALTSIYMIYTLIISAGGIMIYTIVAHLINERAENMRLREKEYIYTLQQTQYQYLQERIEEARTAKHDMRQHLHMISAYLSDKKYDELEAYINRFRKTIPENAAITYCEHYAVNALLQYFAGLAKHHSIGFAAHIHLTHDITIPDESLAVLLGNLLENAVEACASEERPLISVRGKLDGGEVFFKVINTFTGKTKKTADGLYLSTKHEGRGIGLRSVRSIVSEYKGMLKISQEDGLFTVSVMLRLP